MIAVTALRNVSSLAARLDALEHEQKDEQSESSKDSDSRFSDGRHGKDLSASSEPKNDLPNNEPPKK